MNEAEKTYEKKIKQVLVMLERLKVVAENADSDQVHWGHVGSAQEAIKCLEQAYHHLH